MKTTEIKIDKFYSKLQELLEDTVEKFTEITDLKELKPEDTVVLRRSDQGTKSVQVVLIDSVSESGETVLYRITVLSKKTVSWTPKKLKGDLFLLEEVYPGNFKGDNKKDLQELAAFANLRVNPSIRVGGLFFEKKEDSETKEAKEFQKQVEEYLKERFHQDLRVRFRWSEKSGAVQGIDSPGFNVLIENDRKEVFTDLFHAGAYHHAKFDLMKWSVEDKKLKMEASSPEFDQMIEDYSSLLPSATKAEDKKPVAKEEEKVDGPSY